MPSVPNDTNHSSRSVVVGVENEHVVELLAVVFEPLQSAVAAEVAHGESEGIVVRRLLHGACSENSEPVSRPKLS